jgi:hypothetical protein
MHVIAAALLAGCASIAAGGGWQPLQGTVCREGKETYKTSFPATGTVTVELSGFPADCVFQVGSQGFQDADSSPVDWTDGKAGQPVKHTFRVKAGQPGTIWVELRSRLSGVSLGGWSGVICSKDGPCYTTPERGQPAPAAPATFEGKPVKPPITFQLSASGEGAGAAGVAAAGGAPAAKGRTLRDNALKFTCDYAEGWSATPTERGAYRITGAAGTPEAEAIIAIKVLAKSANPKTADSDLILNVHEELTTGKGAELAKLGPARMAGETAAFASHTYDAPNAQGRRVPFDHVQLVLDHGSNYYLISFVAPHDLFVKQAAAFKSVCSTWQFLP